MREHYPCPVRRHGAKGGSLEKFRRRGPQPEPTSDSSLPVTRCVTPVRPRRFVHGNAPLFIAMLSINSTSPHRELFAPVERPFLLWKRTLDVVCCILALPFFALAVLAVTLLLAIVSPGSLFFRQERIGYMGRRFTIFKFRTMHGDAETKSHQAHFATLLTTNRPMQKLDAVRDQRLIPGAWLLRASGLDELPQIINVLRGDMSLVGPRPCIPYEYEQYSPWQRARCNAIPGLTGLWQVSGKNRTTFDEMVRLDIKYSQTKSLWLDLKIIALTLPALFVQILDTHLLRRRRGHSSAPASDASATARTSKPETGTFAPAR